VKTGEMKAGKTNLPGNLFIGENAFDNFNAFIKRNKVSKKFLLVDENTRQFCLPFLVKKNISISEINIIEISSGEKNKTIEIVQKIVERLFDANADRNALLINLGGGVISDTGGFAASIYKRGIRFINIPTTLLSMADASVGGKTGINFNNNKNLLGTFSDPLAIYIDTSFLSTLPASEFRSGIAEIMKHIILSDADEWGKMLAEKKNISNDACLPDIIRHSIAYKYSITSADYFDREKRKILNFGHTIGHALEGLSIHTDQELKHGEAIAAGMIAELYLSYKLCSFPEEKLSDSCRYISKIFNEIIPPGSNEIFSYLLSDKKNENDKIAFSLLSSPGNPAGIFYPDHTLILEAIEFMKEEFSFARIK
jgi:3-dehydroquinate synthase